MQGLMTGLKVFIPAYLLFVLVGAIAGYNAREEVVREKLLLNGEVVEQDGRYSFIYTCPQNNLVFHHAVDDNSGKFSGTVASIIASQKTVLALPTERYKEYRALLSGVLGGATGGVSLRAVLKKPSGGWTWRQARQTLIGIVATITGYTTGYWLGSRYDTDCDSELAVATLKDTGQRIRMEQARLLLNVLTLENLPEAGLSATGKAVFRWEEDPAFNCSPALKGRKAKLMDSLGGTIADPVSEHFALIDEITRLHGVVAGTRHYQTLVELNLYKHAGQLNKFKDSASGLGKLAKANEEAWNRACAALSAMDIN